ncbi:microsomal glutathione S-transferase 3-like [Gigantopelta aegis]|uniref:microsomal glutathione S-transferase 3-like n=1 Tax=Gigantopelta aegis TaxID=1735272 RepID=UPI001B888E04|nr:microsomal glutathione S-transferase 3-like [Gigantopelta aegis]XP_041348294.1 microsomal glutathione S-transferase 3-like [Gigantopelta aegis]
MSKFAHCLPDGYGYVVLVGVGSTFVNMWMAVNVMRARKKYEVEYPDLYSKTSKEFNCIQRVHQHTLESQSQFLMLLFIGGLQYPKITAATGVVYLIARIAYASGYYTGDPSKRRRGAFGHFAELVLLGNVISFACHQLKWIPFGKCTRC